MAGADVDVGTELRLGLPGGGADAAKAEKRGFEETIDLKLKLPTAGMEEAAAGKPEPAAEKAKRPAEAADKAPAPKAQAVGWPPVRSYRRNVMTVQSVKNKKEEEPEKQQPAANAGGNSSAFVKVSMDGAPYLRKVDLKMYNTYKDLSIALQKMFSTFTATGNNMNEGKLVDPVSGADVVTTYEDKDGDWMLVGDVPWDMFVESCKRLRIMKSSEAIGLAPRTKDKCKNKS
ncbi:hypothetical protein ACP70R_024493 [Stipagrostis hirtigluma subsp. patula]